MLFDFSDYAQLLPLVTNSLLAAALLGLMGGLIGIFVMNRDSSFAVHGISELSFAGAAIALLVGVDVVFGSIVGSLAAAILIAVLGSRAKERNSIIAVLMPFGLGVGILAFTTDQVVVVICGAGAIEQLAVGRSDAVGVTGEQQIGQHTIDGGEPDG